MTGVVAAPTDPHFARAYALKNSGNSAAALEEYNKSILLNPKNAGSYNNRGIIFEEQNLIDKAIADYSTAISIDPRDVRALANRCDAYRKTKFFDGAINDCKKAIELDAKFVSSYIYIANVYIDQNRAGLAIEALDKGILSNLKSYELYVKRSRAYYIDGQYERAISDGAIAINLKPKSYNAYVEVANAEAKRSNYVEAIKFYTKAISYGPNEIFLYLNRAKYYKKVFDFDAAIKDVEQTIYLDERQLKSMDELDRIAAENDKRVQVISAYGRLLGKYEHSAELYARRAEASLKLNDFERARNDAERAAKLDPSYQNRANAIVAGIANERSASSRSSSQQGGSPDYGSKFSEIKSLDDLLQAAKDYESRDLKLAAEFYTEALRRAPTSSRIYQSRAGVRAAQSFHIYAISDMDAAIRLDLDNPEYYFDRAKLYVEIKQPDSAFGDLSNAIRLKPNYADAYVLHGNINLSRNYFRDALDDFNKALELRPSLANNQAFVAARKDAGNQLWTSTNVASAVTPPVKPAPSASPVTSADPVKAASPSLAVAAVQAPPAVSTPPVPSLAVVPETRVALVIGNGAYASAERLDNPSRDAGAVARALREAGFKTVQLKADLRYDEMRRALNDFSAEADQADWAVVYYAGHGIEVGGINYLVPVDARLKTDRAVGFEAVPLDQVLTSIEGAHKLRLVILDACRDNPFVQTMTRTLASRSIGQGLAKVDLGDSGTLVAFAAKHGQQAADGVAGQANSPFVTALIESMAKPGIDIRRMFGMVRDQVLKSTRRQQEPYVYGSLGGDEYLFKQP